MGQTLVFRKTDATSRPLQAGAAGRLINRAGHLFFRSSGKKPPVIVKKILVSRVEGLLNAFLSSAMLAHLRRAYPGAEIHFLADEEALPYLRTEPNVSKVLVHRPLKGLRGAGAAFSSFVSNIRQIRAERYDLCIDLGTGAANTAALLYLGRGRFKTGFNTTGYGFLLDRVAQYRGQAHQMARICEALRPAGINVAEAELKPRFTPTKSVQKDASRVLEGLGVSDGEPFVLVHTGALAAWRKSRWQEVITAIGGVYRLKVAVFDEVYGGFEDCVRLPGLMSFELLAAISGKAALCMTADAVAAHVAASFGTPVLALWPGIEDPAAARPVGAEVEIISKRTDCAPCHRKNGCADMKCMDISARECMEGAARILNPEFFRSGRVVSIRSRQRGTRARG